ncbi:MAG: GntR family transcriptional regulator [Bacillota bacterium]
MSSIKKSSLSTLTKKEILEMIENNEFENNKLPPESKLTKELGVSLSTLREALLMLKKEGVIDKVHGIGSFVHQSALEAEMRIDLISDLNYLIGDGGYEARMEQKDSWVTEVNEIEKEEMNLQDGEEIFNFERIFYGDDVPAVWVWNKIPTKYLNKIPNKKDLENPIYQIFWNLCQEKISQSIFEFIPIKAKQKEKEIFQIKKGTPMISWKEIFYNLKDDPISHNLLVFNPELIKLKMLRKW